MERDGRSVDYATGRSERPPYVTPKLTVFGSVIEMTASFTLFLPMLGACFTAMLVPTLLNSAPIYDSLRERMPRVKP